MRPIFQAYVREYPHKIWLYIVQYLHVLDPEDLPLNMPGEIHSRLHPKNRRIVDPISLIQLGETRSVPG